MTRSFRERPSGRARHALEAAGLGSPGSSVSSSSAAAADERWAESLGYRVEAVFELEARSELGAPPPFPTFARPPLTRLPAHDVSDCERRCPILAHLVAGRLLAGSHWTPFRQSTRDCDAAGGVFVSLRHVATDTRMARDGFFDGEAQGRPVTAVALGHRAMRAAGRFPARRRRGSWILKLAVTCISRLLEAIVLSPSSMPGGMG